MDSLSHEFFNLMFVENLAESCHHVVIRITKDIDHGTLRNGRDSRGRKHRIGGKVDTEKVMEMYGFAKEKINAKTCEFMYDIVFVFLNRTGIPAYS